MDPEDSVYSESAASTKTFAMVIRTVSVLSLIHNCYIPLKKVQGIKGSNKMYLGRKKETERKNGSIKEFY